MDGSAGSVGRIMAPLLGVPAAPSRRLRAPRPGVPARELHPRRARGHQRWTASTCRPRTARASAWPRTRWRARSASPELRALLALEVRRARGLFAEAEPAIAAAPGLRTDGCALRRRRLPARARPRRADRLRRARAAHRRARLAAPRRRAGGAAPVTRRATLRGADRVPLAGDAARADVLICGASFAGLAVARELAGSRRRRARRGPLRDRRAPDVGLRGADAVAARDGRARGDPPGAAVHGVPHAARLGALPAAVELVGVRLPHALPRAVGPVRTPASRPPT